jgi:hypothetical protein
VRYFGGEMKTQTFDAGGEVLCDYLDRLCKSALSNDQFHWNRGFLVSSPLDIATPASQIRSRDKDSKNLLTETAFSVFTMIFPQILGLSPLEAPLKEMIKPQAHFQPAQLDFSLIPDSKHARSQESWTINCDLNASIRDSTISLERIGSTDRRDECLLRLSDVDISTNLELNLSLPAAAATATISEVEIAAEIKVKEIDVRLEPTALLPVCRALKHISRSKNAESERVVIQVYPRLSLRLYTACEAVAFNCFVSKVNLVVFICM